MILSILFHNLSLCIQFAIWCVAFFPALFPFLDKALFNRHISIKNHRIIIAWLHSHRKCKRNEMPWVWFELRQHFDTNTNTNIKTDIQSLSLKITNQPNMIAATLSYIYLSLLVKIHCGTMCARVLCVYVRFVVAEYTFWFYTPLAQDILPTEPFIAIICMSCTYHK